MKPLIVICLAFAVSAFGGDRPVVNEDPVKDPSYQRGTSDAAEDALQHDAPLGDGEDPGAETEPDQEPPSDDQASEESPEPEVPAEDPIDPEDEGVDWGW